jgi:hypothetical protein
MRDLTNPKLMALKAALFAVIGIASAILLYLVNPHWHTALLLALTIWSFCRIYYFAFYVIERYIDPDFHFSGLGSALRYILTRRKSR